MKQFILYTFLGLMALTVVAWALIPRRVVDGKVALTWTSDDNPARRGQITLFNQEHPKLKLTLDPDNSDMEKVIVQSIAGVGPDLFDSYDPLQLTAYVKSGIAWDITDELKKRGIDVNKTVWDVTKPDIELDGRVYGCPTNASGNALWCNKDLFDKAGVPIPKGPWQWRQFIPVAKKLTVIDPTGRNSQYGILIDWTGDWEQFCRQWGGHLYSPNGTKCTLDSPQCVAAVQFMSDLVNKYKVAPSASEQETMATAGGWGSGTISLFEGGHFATAIGGRWWLCTMRTEPSLHLAACECPYQDVQVYMGGAKGTLINKNSPYREQALDFSLYELSKPYNDLINHQADAMGPVIKYCYSPEFMHDPSYPDEIYNDVWRDALKYSVQGQISPYMNPVEQNLITTAEIQLVESGDKTAAEAMHDAAAKINAEIQQNISRDPALKARYDREIEQGRP
jgi:multiple sugar transport system substrate-binding protein